MINRTKRYSTLMIIMHWSTTLFVVFAYLISHGGPDIRSHPPALHMGCGLAVLLLVLPRLLGRFSGGAPPLEEIGGKWNVLIARLGHTTLYALLIAVPMTGWYTASRLGLDVPGFGAKLPSLTLAVEGQPGAVAGLHQIGGNLLLILAVLHALMALWHHFVRHDNTLRRMNPF